MRRLTYRTTYLMTSLPAECVFLVDDDEDDRFLIHQIFKQLSPQCVLKLIPNGRQLLEALKQTSKLPTLILLDLNMPLMGGFEALASIRQQSSYDAIPVIILTTSDQAADRQQAIALKADGFMTKPVTIEELNQLVLQLRHTWLEGSCVGTSC